MTDDYYVYVYIDPRNFEEFYFGKGRGSRKGAHLSDETDTEKTRRIAAIQKAGLDPIIRVIARNLTSREALLIEKTLLWKLGKQLTNISSGHFAEKFRPHDTLHAELSGFDYRKGVYYYNVGEGPHRNWDDYIKFGFISAGQGEQWRDQILGFNEGDVIAAYLKRRGFVGIGVIMQRAKPIRNVSIKGLPLLRHKLQCDLMSENANSASLCEYVALVGWKKYVGRENAKWKDGAGLYTTPLIRASLDRQSATIAFLEKEFAINMRRLAT